MERCKASVQRTVIRFMAFDRRARLKCFCTMSVILIGLLQSLSKYQLAFDQRVSSVIYIHGSYTSNHWMQWLNPSQLSAAVMMVHMLRWTSLFLLKVGWLSAFTTEYLAMIFDRVPDSMAEMLALTISYYTMEIGLRLVWLHGMLLSLVAEIDHDHSYEMSFWQLLFACASALWLVGCILAFAPCHFQIRTTPLGQPVVQYLHLTIWYKMDFCVAAVNAPLPVNGVFVDPATFPLQASAWPTMDDAPRWIIMKLNQQAAPAG